MAVAGNPGWIDRHAKAFAEPCLAGALRGFRGQFSLFIDD
jgi:hypothetical protein